MRRIYQKDNVRITLLVFLVIAGLYIAPARISFLQPMAKALGDFELTDLYFSQLRDDRAITADTNIVLVNIAELPRSGVARELEIIGRNNPKVIGIDAFFRRPKTPELDTPLARVCAGLSNLVFVNQLLQWNADSSRFDSVATSLPQFTATGRQGFANLLIRDDAFRTAREFTPKEMVDSTIELAFGVRILQMYDSLAFRDLMARGKPTEFINFRGNTDKFLVLDATDVLEKKRDLSFLRDKIVLMGFLGPRLGAASLEDAFFTPLNARYAGKSFPDMYGVTIHANIISMVLHREYIGTLPLWLQIALAVLLCHLQVVFLSWLFDRHERWFDAITTGVQLAEVVAVLFLTMYVFEQFHFRLDVTLSLVALVASINVFEVYHSLIHRTLSAVKEKILRKSSQQS